MRYILSIILSAYVCMTAIAGGSVSCHLDEVPGGYNYILYTPDSISAPMPLVVALHSRNASGNNLSSVDYFGTIDAIESGMRINAFVVAPQATGDRWDPSRVMAVVDSVIANNNIDANKISAIGMSMGGNGVADFAAAYPDKLAAAIVLAGSLTSGDVAELSKVPLWVIRGLKDRDEAILRTDNMVGQIRQTDSTRVAYSRVKGIDHRQHERMLYMPAFYDWLTSHDLREADRPIHPTFKVDSKMLNNAYKGLHLRDGSAALRKSRGHGPRRPRR